MIFKAYLYKKDEHRSVDCLLCCHRCHIEKGKFGFCGVRQNVDGELYSLFYGNLIASNIDPIEKKPLYHFFPKTDSYSIAQPGCNFRCGFCQNWQISQLRASKLTGRLDITEATPEEIVNKATASNCHSISYTYTEPTVFFEFAYDTAKLAKKKGLYNVFVTNGYMTQEAIDMISPYLDAVNVDLKAFKNETYKTVCKGELGPVLKSIEYMRKIGIWVEITTLVVPDMNDSYEELKQIADFVFKIGKEVPWHISRFYPNYEYMDYEPTTIETMKIAYNLGKEAGLRYIYLGNVSNNADTYCYKCKRCLIRRDYIFTIKNRLIGNRCPDCGAVIDGYF